MGEGQQVKSEIKWFGTYVGNEGGRTLACKYFRPTNTATATTSTTTTVGTVAATVTLPRSAQSNKCHL